MQTFILAKNMQGNFTIKPQVLTCAKIKMPSYLRFKFTHVENVHFYESKFGCIPSQIDLSQFLFNLRLPDLLPLVDFFFFLVLSLGVSDPLSLLCNLRDESEVVLPILPLGVFGGAKISSSE